KLPYDTLNDFAPIGLIGDGAYVLVINPNIPAKTIGDFVALAKTRPGQLNYAASGRGNATHLAGELFKVLAGIDMVAGIYKGGVPLPGLAHVYRRPHSVKTGSRTTSCAGRRS